MGKVKDFWYNKPMTNLDKYYSDADRLASRGANRPKDEFAKALVQLFSSWSRDFEPIASALCGYWQGRYADTLDTEAGKTAAVEWFGSLLSLFYEDFPRDKDFADDDWEEIRDTVSAEAESLDMDLVTSILSVIVERGKA